MLCYYLGAKFINLENLFSSRWQLYDKSSLDLKQLKVKKDKIFFVYTKTLNEFKNVWVLINEI